MIESAYVPVRFVKNLVELVADEEELRPATILRSTGVNLNTLMDENAMITFDQQLRIYDRVAALSTIPGIGFRSPSAQNFADQGMLGALMILAPTVGEAFQKLQQFINVVGGLVDYRFERSAKDVRLTTRDKRRYSPLTHRLIAEENYTVWKFSSLPMPDLETHLKEVHFDYPKPRHWRMYTDIMSRCEVKFSQPEIAIILSPEIMDLPIRTHNPDAYRKIESACEELLSRMRPSIKGLVNQCLEQIPPADWSAANVADALNMTQKTLSRRLQAEGTSTKQLIETTRRNHALSLLEKQTSDAQIARELGYADNSSFSRAFRKWTGESPAQHRRNQ